MARYIKANPKVAAFLGLTNDRNTVKDGNYLLWQGDMLAFGPLTLLSETLTQIGGIALMPHEAREEQDGTVTRPLPTATDPRFVMDTAPAQESPENAPENDAPDQVEGEAAPVSESPAEAQEPAQDEGTGEGAENEDNDNPEND